MATCQAATQSWAGEMVLRFLLGAAEAGFGPSVSPAFGFVLKRPDFLFVKGEFIFESLFTCIPEPLGVRRQVLTCLQIPYLLSFFYLRHEHGFRSGIFLAAAPLANTFAGALAYGITSGHPKVAKWRLLFLVEGIPTILAAPLAWFYLPDSPTSAKFLTAEEKEVARARVVRQHGTQSEESHRVSLKEIGLTLVDAKAWFTAVSIL